MSEESRYRHARDDGSARPSPPPSVDVCALRLVLHDALSTYLEAQRQYWITRHTVQAHRHYQEATAHLKTALRALLTYLQDDPGSEAEYRRLAHVLAEVYAEQDRVQERAALEWVRALT